MNQNLQTLHLRDVGFQRPRDGIHRQLLARNPRRNGICERLGKIRDGRPIRQKIKRQEQSIRRQCPQFRIHRSREQRVQNLLRSQYGIARKRQVHRYRHQRGIDGIRSPEKFGLYSRITRINRDRLRQFAPRLFLTLLLELCGALHSSAQNGHEDYGNKQNEDQSACEKKFPARRHGSAPGVVGTTYEGLNAAAPRAIASATPGAMRSKSARSSTVTLETSTAMAGAAVVRSWRTLAVCAVSGEPLNRCARNPCTKSPNVRLNPRNGTCARSQGMKPFEPATGAKSEFTYTRTVPGNPVDEMCSVTNTAPRCALAVADRSSNEGSSFPCRVCTTWKPCCSSARRTSMAKIKTNSLSRIPPVPRAPGS